MGTTGITYSTEGLTAVGSVVGTGVTDAIGGGSIGMIEELYIEEDVEVCVSALK